MQLETCLIHAGADANEYMKISAEPLVAVQELFWNPHEKNCKYISGLNYGTQQFLTI